jgi:adenine-specific DNA-methyltransferase
LWKGFSSDGGNLAKEGYVSFKNGKKPKRLLRQLIRAISSDEQKNSMIVLDFFAGSGTTGHAVMELNATDGGHRSFILVNNNDEGICEKVTYERLKRVIERDKYAASLKYFKVDYIPIGGKVYYDYADELLKHIRELVELENAIDFRTDSTIAIAVTDKEFEKFVANDKNMEGKRALYVGHDVLIGKSARQKLERRGIEIRIIPQYYYSEQEA